MTTGAPTVFDVQSYISLATIPSWDDNDSVIPELIDNTGDAPEDVTAKEAWILNREDGGDSFCRYDTGNPWHDGAFVGEPHNYYRIANDPVDLTTRKFVYAFQPGPVGSAGNVEIAFYDRSKSAMGDAFFLNVRSLHEPGAESWETFYQQISIDEQDHTDNVWPTVVVDPDLMTAMINAYNVGNLAFRVAAQVPADSTYMDLSYWQMWWNPGTTATPSGVSPDLTAALLNTGVHFLA